MDCQELFLAFRNEREEVSLNEILTYIAEADPRVQSNCQLLTTKIKRYIQGAQRPDDVRVEERTLKNLFDANPRTKANFDIMFDYLTQGQTEVLTTEQLRNANQRFKFSLSPEQLELMMRTISQRPDSSITRGELYDFITQQQ